MATYGKIKPYNPKSDDWDVYEEKLHFYMDANGITDAKKKRSILLTVCGDSTFKLLRSLVPDGKLDADDVSFDSLMKLLKSHYGKKTIRRCSPILLQHSIEEIDRNDRRLRCSSARAGIAL